MFGWRAPRKVPIGWVGASVMWLAVLLHTQYLRDPSFSPRRHARRRLAFLLPLEESIGLKAAGEFLALDRGGSNPKPGKPHPLCTYSAWGSFAPLRTLLGTGLTDQELLSFLLKCCTAGKGLEMSSGHWFDVCLRQHMFPPTSAALPN
eukprot:m.165708 g.165708  ORF g.165708 m.165708 type:complete len:148 (+) comp17743_c0_seq2:1715-2158(+)